MEGAQVSGSTPIALASLLWLMAPPTLLAGQPGGDPTGAVRGLVVDADTGAPLSGVLVVVQNPEQRSVTGDDGRFELTNVAPGRRTLFVSLVGYVLARPDVEVVERAVAELTVPLTSGAGTYTEQVTVRAERATPRSAAPIEFRVRSADLQELRGVLADDAYRALQSLPGVATGDDFRAEFSVRGSEFRQMGFVVDGISAPWLVHGPQDVGDTGTVAMINADVLDEITLTSGASAQPFGNRTGAWIQSAIREGSRDAVRVNTVLSGTGASAVVEGPIGRSRRGSWLLTARQSYIDWLLRRLDFTSGATFGFTDAQSKAVFDVSPRHQFQLTAVAGRSKYDEPDETPSANGLKVGGSATQLVLGAWRATLGDRVVVVQRLAGARLTYRNTGDFDQELGRGRSETATARTDLTVSARAWLTLDASAQVDRERSRAERRQYAGTGATTPALRVAQTWTWGRWRSGAHVRTRLVPSSVLQLDAGSRLDHESQTGTTTASPWTVARWTPYARLTIGAGANVTHQVAELTQIPLGPTAIDLRPERARALDASAELRPATDWIIQLAAYDRREREALRFDDALPRLVNGVRRLPPATFAWQNAIDVSARGLELMVRRTAASGLVGWVAYAYGRTENTDRATGERYWSDFDQRHLLNVHASYRLGTRTNASAKFRYGSNMPVPGYFAGEAETLVLSARRNDVRLPAYARLDLRLNRTFNFTRRRLTLFAEVLNVLNRGNLGRTDGFVRANGLVTGYVETMLPLLPSAGFRLEF